MNEDKLVKVKYVYAKDLSIEMAMELGVVPTDGLIAIETRILRSTSCKEVMEICKIYNDGYLAKAIDLYEQRLLELVDKLK